MTNEKNQPRKTSRKACLPDRQAQCPEAQPRKIAKREGKPQKIINLPETEVSIKPLTLIELEKNSKRRASQATEELIKGFAFINSHPKSITFFGSARFDEHHPYYKKARAIAKRISDEGFAVVTGGGPGVMEAANRGATDGCGESCGNKNSLGICIKLPHEQITNPYVTSSTEFKFFFTRKVILTFSAEAYIYFPGGFGTLDEFFEIVTLIQTNKIERIPIILVGDEYWKPLDKFIRKTLYEKYNTINEKDMDLYTVTEDEDKILEIVKNAPLRRE